MNEDTIIAELNNEEIRNQSHLAIPSTKRTPKIIFNPKKGYLSVEGRSYPTNAKSFYYPVMDKVYNYLENPQDKTRVVFTLEYINSTSTQLIQTLVNRLRKAEIEGYKIEVEWRFMEDDEDIKDIGYTFSESSGLEFTFIEDESQSDGTI